VAVHDVEELRRPTLWAVFTISFPRVGGELALGEDPPDVVVEDLRGLPGSSPGPALGFGRKLLVGKMPRRRKPLQTSIG